MNSGLLLLALFAQGPDAAFKLGEKVFTTSCAVGYCHGQGGSANRGPRLAGRGFAQDYLERVVRKGIPNTAMPGFEGRLKPDALEAVIAYTAKLSAAKETIVPANTPEVKLPPPVPVQHRRGRDLFFDPNRIVRCGTCHLAQGEGLNVAALRKDQVRRAALADGTSFPAIVQSEAGGLVKIFDLTVPPPVLRTILQGDVKLEPLTGWNHSAVMGKYSAAEVTAIRRYIAWAAER